MSRCSKKSGPLLGRPGGDGSGDRCDRGPPPRPGPPPPPRPPPPPPLPTPPPNRPPPGVPNPPPNPPRPPPPNPPRPPPNPPVPNGPNPPVPNGLIPPPLPNGLVPMPPNRPGGICVWPAGARPWIASITSWTRSGSMLPVGTSCTTLVESLARSSSTSTTLAMSLAIWSVAIPTILFVRSSAERLSITCLGRPRESSGCWLRPPANPNPNGVPNPPANAPPPGDWLAAWLVLSRYTSLRMVTTSVATAYWSGPMKNGFINPVAPAESRTVSNRFWMVIRSRALARTNSELLDCSATIRTRGLVASSAPIAVAPPNGPPRPNWPNGEKFANGFWFRP